MESWLLWIKAFHIMAVIAWMAGLFYLPRLFVYHADAKVGGEQSATFKVMERRLLKGIMNPSMIAVWLSGPWIAYLEGAFASPWLHAKLFGVLLLSGFHAHLSRTTKTFAADANRRSPRYFRIINEVPTVLMAAIVILVVVKPF
jgi:putative membrane protein